MVYGSENLIIKQKLEDAIEYSYCVFRHFPKSERFTLVADLKHSQIKILQLVWSELNRILRREVNDSDC